MNHKMYRWAIIATCLAVTACSSNKDASQPVEYLSNAENVQPVAYLEQNTVPADWLTDKEALLRESIKDSPFTLHQQGNAWVVTASAQQAFNADRPNLLLPAVLRPITRVAKMLEANPDSAVLILGHTDIANDAQANHKLSTDRARAVASIFSLTGLTSGRMTHLGLGGSHLLDKQKSTNKNHRVEIIITPQAQIQDVLAVYHPAYVRQLALSQAR
ncbi:OmpA family protein [Pseudomonas sp. C27(2019)]|uniref:OmpA family protein n=1 Tax=Pseudomonas sp. C27(2019) TaxID=2604941 RepID=UPI0012491CA4|nr:OmpA family protein [Pseudomonas sp. C27(2019)]QEY58870.1 OmpA family protein [Pseudomonas sp. C27(2019)]